MSKRVISVRLNDELIARLDVMASPFRTRSDLIEEAIRLMLSVSLGTAEMHYKVGKQG